MSFVEIIIDQIDKLDNNRKKILLNIKDLLNEMRLDNVHEVFYLYCYLLWNGYLSYNKKHVFCDYDINADIDYSIEDKNLIFLGKGVCRHYATFLNELLKYINYKSNCIEIRLNASNINFIMNIKRKIDKKTTTYYKNIEGLNHKIVVVKTGERIFMLDPTNLCEQEVLCNKKIFVPNGEYNIDENNFFKTLDCYYGINRKYPKKSIISDTLLNEYYNEVRNKCTNQKKLIKDFYKETQPYYKKQVELIKFFKN